MIWFLASLSCLLDVDCYGNDISQSDSMSLDGCGEWCSETAGCVGIVFSDDNNCWLKDVCDTSAATEDLAKTLCSLAISTGNTYMY